MSIYTTIKWTWIQIENLDYDVAQHKMKVISDALLFYKILQGHKSKVAGTTQIKGWLVQTYTLWTHITQIAAHSDFYLLQKLYRWLKSKTE
jgi:hypothetical protein